jgi:hypothetical protein
MPEQEEKRKTQALEELAIFVNGYSDTPIEFARIKDANRDLVSLFVGGYVVENFSIAMDSPRAVLFDAMQAIVRHTGKLL